MAHGSGQQSIIIKRIKKVEGGHHGGAWKVAYADFVTAMMAFFLLLWLLNAVTEEQLKGISDYFAPQTVSRSTSGSGGILGGQTLTEGALSSKGAPPNVTLKLPPPFAGKGGDDAGGDETARTVVEKKELTEEEVEQLAAQKEEEEFKKAEKALKQIIQTMPEMKQLKESMLIDNTPEGLRIQLVDSDKLAMFPGGSADMYLHARKLLEQIAKIVLQLPQKIALSGHTDSVPFAAKTSYGNWELSADRALACRRVLLHFGVPEARIDRVVGKGDNDPLIVEDPTSPQNRRIGIVLLREHEVSLSSGN